MPVCVPPRLVGAVRAGYGGVLSESLEAPVTLAIGTHSGTFHADDVMAVALIRTFVDADATVVRTRDDAVLDRCDLVVDVGGIFDPAKGRFDHHQASYTGPHSSAGLVLNWLEDEGKVSSELADYLRKEAVEYVDAVDVGATSPTIGVPCLPRLVETFVAQADDDASRLAMFEAAVVMNRQILQGMVREHERLVEARTVVEAAMRKAEAEGTSVVELDRYYRWKPAYFELGGESHPTAFMMFPADNGTYKVLAIPPVLGSFAQKVSLPESWGGKMGEELQAATGVEGSVFCHKNLFIAVFQTREGALKALGDAGLLGSEIVGRR